MWVIRAANTGFSFAVDPNGVIHTDTNLKLGREGFGIFDIMINDPCKITKGCTFEYIGQSFLFFLFYPLSGDGYISCRAMIYREQQRKP